MPCIKVQLTSVTVYYAKFFELCSAVQADIASAFVVRKFLRKLNPLLRTHLIVHCGGRVKLEERNFRGTYSALHGLAES
jgi:hypothetical protein